MEFASVCVVNGPPQLNKAKTTGFCLSALPRSQLYRIGRVRVFPKHSQFNAW
jgi:hypothetical protein